MILEMSSDVSEFGLRVSGTVQIKNGLFKRTKCRNTLLLFLKSMLCGRLLGQTTVIYISVTIFTVLEHSNN